MAPEYLRVCPTCGAENAPDVLRCACGAMLFGVDLVRPGASAAKAPARVSPTAPKAAGLTCPYEDCGQISPPNSDRCVYCNRPFARGAALTSASEFQSLLALPAALADRYRIVQAFPAAGAEADLMLVEPASGGQRLVAKIYRQGIQPKSGVQERISRIDPRYRVRVVESGKSGGHAFEVMEYCAGGSLRDWLKGRALEGDALVAIVRELEAAIAAVHAAGLVHRDLKPENVLVRSEQPLELLLIDFGISSVMDATQRFTGIARTLPYASPESLSGVIDAKADYWALGMILLEAALGKHPFAGLSEAVILHHLTTRSIDLGGVRDPGLRKLLKGLLQRDPGARWGHGEVARWLAGDGTLAEPAEASVGEGFAEPYHIGDHVCRTREQLAIALSRNWKEGVADIGNGQLLAWFRDVQKDQNAVRVLLETQQEKHLHVDVCLLRLLLYLAPGLPPVWRGENIELTAILARANLALKGDADAARWLDALYQHRVLEAYAQAGNAEAAEIVKRWNASIDRFAKAWETRVALIKRKAPPGDPNEVPLFDDLVYGKDQPDPPPLLSLHPRLLALAYDPSWSERLRERLLVELGVVAAHCPWLAELGDARTMDAVSLLVLESLMPEARKAADRQIKASAQQRTAQAEESHLLERHIKALVKTLRTRALGQRLSPRVCEELQADLVRFFELAARVRSAGGNDETSVNLQQSLRRLEPLAGDMQTLLEVLAERRAANSGWLGQQTLLSLALAVVFLPGFFGARAAYFLGAAVAGVLAWRLLPNHFTIQNIRELAQRL